jgi:long-chain acyl-CoA synthetase
MNCTCDPSEPTASDPRGARTIPELLQRAAVTYGDKVAVQVCRDGKWTRLSHRELADRAEAWGRVLASAGLRRGGRAVLAADGCPEWGVAYFAAMSRGATVVPLDPQLPAEDVLAIAQRTEARIWLLSSAVRERVADVSAKAEMHPAILQIDHFCAPPSDALLAAKDGDAHVGSGEVSVPAQDPGGVASIPFTSGTTLAPKGVPLTHANFLANVRALLDVVHVDRSDEFLSVLPMHHVLGFTANLLLPLAAGATVTHVERLTPKALLDALQATGTTLLIAVPRLFSLLVKGIRVNVEAGPPARRRAFALLLGLARMARGLARIAPALAPHLRRLRAALFCPVHQRFGDRVRLLVSGGAALPPEIFDTLDLLGFCICEGYGLTETAPVLTLDPPERPRAGTVGRPLPGVELRIGDPGVDGVGEVLARGPNVFGGYFEDDEATRRAFSGEWLRTGDHGRLDSDGHLLLSGRADDMIVTGGGKNVYPVEVEWLYRELPHVREMCVLGMPDPGSAGDAVHAVVVLDDTDGGSSPEVRRQEVESALARISRGLPAHQRVRRIHFRDGDLPRTSTLKVRRREVRRVLLQPAEGEREK